MIIANNSLKLMSLSILEQRLDINGFVDVLVFFVKMNFIVVIISVISMLNVTCARYLAS